MFKWLLRSVGGRDGYHHRHRLPTEKDLEGAIKITPEKFAEIAKQAGWPEDKIRDHIDQCLLNAWPIRLNRDFYEIINLPQSQSLPKQ